MKLYKNYLQYTICGLLLNIVNKNVKNNKKQYFMFTKGTYITKNIQENL